MSNQFNVNINNRFDITVIEGQTFTPLFIFTDADGNSIDLSGAVAKLIVSEHDLGACINCDYLTFESTATITGNRLQFNDTISLPADTYKYYVFLQYPNEETKDLLTGNFKVRKESGSGSAELPYKVYTALLNQTGTDAPVPTVLQNTLGGTPIWTRDSIGFYTAALTGGFPLSKTTLQIQSFNGSYIMTAYTNDGNSIGIGVEHAIILFINPNWVYATSGVEDGILYETFFEIRVYE